MKSVDNAESVSVVRRIEALSGTAFWRQRPPAMICSKVFDSIEVHANGNIVCWCADVNGEHVYGNAFTDRIADIWQGEAYKEMRDWMLKSKPDTWCPAINRHCALRNVVATDELTQAPHRIRYRASSSAAANCF